MSWINRKSEDKQNPFISLSVGQFLEQELPPQENMLEPWLPKQGLVMIYAARGIGKTFFALEIALATASGQSFLNWRPQGAYRVLYLDGEMQANQLQERIRSLSHRYQSWDSSNLILMPCGLQAGAMPDLSSRVSQEALEPHLESVDLIVVDNISTLCRTGMENEAESWRSVQDWLLRQRANGKSVLLVHHSGKSGEQRGTSKREDILDAVISLKRPEGYHASEGARFEVVFEKTRSFSGDDAQSQIVRLMETPEGFEWESEKALESTFDQIVRLSNEGLERSAIAQKVQKDKSTISRNINKARQLGLLTD